MGVAERSGVQNLEILIIRLLSSKVGHWIKLNSREAVRPLGQKSSITSSAIAGTKPQPSGSKSRDSFLPWPRLVVQVNLTLTWRLPIESEQKKDSKISALFHGSFTNPQFNRDTLESSSELDSAHISYLWFGPLLGGRRNAKQPKLEEHTTIRVAAFRNYAGYMLTQSFKNGLAELKGIAENLQTSNEGYLAIMCSETVWWRCHRRMIADILVTQGWNVQHLGVRKEPMEHERWGIARVGDEGNLIYDGRERRSKRNKCLS
ncbi:predicted protein [Histoplasma mississippiense (nom. inval.)]|uniref:predicted protein n=1 Tax=Ajellomyces capsulatus (strain NAm1 / WU24) TaxID=2059318 RepID=UPI000157BE24|nr:predicted protein [Histoplasma mississippiense (nom. inval.)]EDN06329.1 predicted protein [Histoplasma mississippiense (nom. inval.)]